MDTSYDGGNQLGGLLTNWEHFPFNVASKGDGKLFDSLDVFLAAGFRPKHEWFRWREADGRVDQERRGGEIYGAWRKCSLAF